MKSTSSYNTNAFRKSMYISAHGIYLKEATCKKVFRKFITLSKKNLSLKFVCFCQFLDQITSLKYLQHYFNLFVISDELNFLEFKHFYYTVTGTRSRLLLLENRRDQFSRAGYFSCTIFFIEIWVVINI